MNRRALIWALWPVVAACLGVSGCATHQTRFSTPEQAAESFVRAVRSDDSVAMGDILGPGAAAILSSGDEVADRRTREQFLQAYDAKHSLVGEADGSTTLQVGLDDWPMPIPIVQHRDSWRFDARIGQEEILNRRIGRNELSVREVCLAVVDAQREYAALDRDGDGLTEYAEQFLSDAGLRNGLYWTSNPGEPRSPLGVLAAEAASEGYSVSGNVSRKRHPYHGYFFKILKAQGPHAPGGKKRYVVNGSMTAGFAVVAWPADYGNSGVMTFLISHQGVLYERDLGRTTERVAASLSAFDPDSRWRLSIDE